MKLRKQYIAASISVMLALTASLAGCSSNTASSPSATASPIATEEAISFYADSEFTEIVDILTDDGEVDGKVSVTTLDFELSDEEIEEWYNEYVGPGITTEKFDYAVVVYSNASSGTSSSNSSSSSTSKMTVTGIYADNKAVYVDVDMTVEDDNSYTLPEKAEATYEVDEKTNTISVEEDDEKKEASATPKASAAATSDSKSDEVSISDSSKTSSSSSNSTSSNSSTSNSSSSSSSNSNKTSSSSNSSTSSSSSSSSNSNKTSNSSSSSSSNKTNNSGTSSSSSGSSSSSNSGSSSSNSSSSSSSTTTHTHNWVAEYTTVHHDAVTKSVHHDAVTHTEQVWIQDSEAYDEQVQTSYAVITCNGCGQEFLSASAWDDHCAYYVSLGDYSHGGYTIEARYNTTTVHHEATGHYETKTVTDQAAYDETVVVTAAYDERVLSGYKCSTCNETKSK